VIFGQICPRYSDKKQLADISVSGGERVRGRKGDGEVMDTNPEDMRTQRVLIRWQISDVNSQFDVSPVDSAKAPAKAKQQIRGLCLWRSTYPANH
jgi:hypothetical protein